MARLIGVFVEAMGQRNVMVRVTSLAKSAPGFKAGLSIPAFKTVQPLPDGRQPLAQHVLVSRAAGGRQLGLRVGQCKLQRASFGCPLALLGSCRRPGRPGRRRISLLRFDGLALPPPRHEPMVYPF